MAQTNETPTSYGGDRKIARLLADPELNFGDRLGKLGKHLGYSGLNAGRIQSIYAQINAFDGPVWAFSILHPDGPRLTEWHHPEPTLEVSHNLGIIAIPLPARNVMKVDFAEIRRGEEPWDMHLAELGRLTVADFRAGKGPDYQLPIVNPDPDLAYDTLRGQPLSRHRGLLNGAAPAVVLYDDLERVQALTNQLGYADLDIEALSGVTHAPVIELPARQTDHSEPATAVAV